MSEANNRERVMERLASPSPPLRGTLSHQGRGLSNRLGFLS